MVSESGKVVIKLVGKYNDLELGYFENNTYHKTGLLADHEHGWKILEWIHQNLQDGFSVRVQTTRQRGV